MKSDEQLLADYRDLGQLDVAEAARIEGCTRATMYWRIHEARKRLKQRLQRYLSP